MIGFVADAAFYGVKDSHGVCLAVHDSSILINANDISRLSD